MTGCLGVPLLNTRLSFWFKPGLGFGTDIGDGWKVLMMTI